MNRFHQKRRFFSSAECLEQRLCLSAVAFVSRVISASETSGAIAVVAADLDKDGDLDVISGSSVNGRVGWYPNLDGTGIFGEQREIQAGGREQHVQSVSVADLDGDRDLDVLIASTSGERFAWYENIDGRGTFGVVHAIATDSNASGRSLQAADIDGDRDLDLLATTDGGVAWYENTDGKGSFGPQNDVLGANRSGSLDVADFDSDGDIDFVLASRFDGEIAWFENVDGRGTYTQSGVLSALAAHDVKAADVDKDGNVDILAASDADDFIAWYPNVDGEGEFEGPEFISELGPGARSLMVADVDLDGSLDVLTASYIDGISWYQNTNGIGDFDERHIVSTSTRGAWSVFAADLDGDGDMDALSASYLDDKIAWYENVDGSGTFGRQQMISRSVASGVRSVQTADVDGDGDLDVLSASMGDNKIAWYENLDGRGSFGAQRVISLGVDRASSVHATDLDADGDLDILAGGSDLVWFENTDGRGSFGPRIHLGNGEVVNAADLDGDGDVDVLSTSFGEVVWYENRNGVGRFGNAQVISDISSSVEGSVSAVDFDGDGDLDVLSGGNEIAWHENLDGRGTFSQPNFIVLGGQSLAADFDGDGDFDILSGARFQEGIAWHENTNSRGQFNIRHDLPVERRRVASMQVSDVDGDGDADVVIADQFASQVFWLENVDGRGSFGRPVPISNFVGGASSVFVADLDADGDADVVSAAEWEDTIVWHEQRVVGDSNRDGLFNSTDLVLVFRAGIYEDGVPGNAVFEQGDWNGDGEFDSADLVYAFQCSSYQFSSNVLEPLIHHDMRALHETPRHVMSREESPVLRQSQRPPA